jgi:hypothetical protein
MIKKLKLTNDPTMPVPETEPRIDWHYQVLDKAMSVGYLAYAVQRDFLSTPRTFAIVEIDLQVDQKAWLQKTLEAHDQFNYLKAINDLAFEDFDATGFYQFNNSIYEGVNSVLMFGEVLLPIACHKYQLKAHIYHCLDASEALAEFLAR